MDARELLEQKDFVPPEVKDIEITDAAINRLLQVGYKQVEFSVEGGGCSGTQIDYSDDLLNGGFKFTNPQANRTCGCGTSFSV